MTDILGLSSATPSCPVSHMALSLSTPNSYDTCICSYSLNSSPTTSSSSPHFLVSPTPSTSLFSRQEPLLFFSFDLNPNTSIFMPMFIIAFILQTVGFFLFKRFVPQVADFKTNRRNRRALSWVLSLFSSIVLFTGMFTLSSEIEWSLPGVVTDSIERKSTSSFLVASLHRFPHESRLATAYCAYFTSYLICDLGLGMAYYRDFIDPLSGWAHHLFYLGVMSRAASQGSISTFFAIGTPIEVSTIFLATGHIFPTLRSDILFATSFFLARIVYPIALLPELYLNVESRLCWKIGALAFLVHIYWFHKVIQQQTRYYHARQEQKQQQCIADFSVKSNMTVQAAEAIEKKTDSETIPNVDTIKKSSIIYEHEPTTVPMAKPLEENTPESPKNEMCGMELPSANQIQVNSSRHRRPRVVRLSSGQSISSLTFFEKADDETVDAPTTITADIPLPAITISTDTTPAPTPIPTSTTIAQAAASKGAKTMKQLLEECSDEDITIYKFPIHNNKTFSALTRKPSNGSHGPLSGDQGVIRLSRASSMRDSKRRIALGAVQFACPSIDEPKEAKELTNQGVAETKGSIRKKVEKNVDMDATVVMRPRRTSPPRDGDYGFGTIRVSRGGIVAVNA